VWGVDEQQPGAIVDTTAEPKQIEVKQKTGALPKWWCERKITNTWRRVGPE
jgi:hypothetical protein